MDSSEPLDSRNTRPHRNADNTRRLLIKAARHRFARDGYSATRVRAIASDAGVSVALINRYFSSKEGLFEACVAETATGLAPIEDGPPVGIDEVITRLVTRVANSPDADSPLQMLLLLRSSGNDRADVIRRDTLQKFTRGLLEFAVQGDGDLDRSTMLRAQVAMATLFGLLQLRNSTGVEPATSATADELAGPVREVLMLLLGPASG